VRGSLCALGDGGCQPQCALKFECARSLRLSRLSSFSSSTLFYNTTRTPHGVVSFEVLEEQLHHSCVAILCR
jgi:hypothetical protein